MASTLWLFSLLFVFDVVEPIPPHKIMQLDKDMKQFLKDHVAERVSQENKLKKLTFYIFSPDFINLAYEHSGTQTAVETFHNRRGNCLSFTLMFVAMARHVGLNARFQEVYTLPSWERYGRAVALNRHMIAVVSIRGQNIPVDFNPFQERRENLSILISDDRAHAQFYNNLGAEYYGNGDAASALVFFQKALSLDARVSNTWTNLGVAYSELGEYVVAEEAYLEALRLDRFEYTAMSNLAKLYQKTGFPQAAEKYWHRAESFAKQNPYHNFSQAMKAFNETKYRTAIKFYKLAIAQKDDEHEFHFELARAYGYLGNLKEAQLSFNKALALTNDKLVRDHYTHQFEEILKQ